MSESGIIVTRFAPSPTGELHLGHAHSALFAWRAARRAGGRFLVRIEDIDRSRCRPEFEHTIFMDLAWLGLDWDGLTRRQSEHFQTYRIALEKLSDRGVLYPCFCTRAEIEAEIARAGGAPHGVDGPAYPGTCLRLSRAACEEMLASGRPHALRLDSAAAFAQVGTLVWHDRERGMQTTTPAHVSDVVLSRKDTLGSYHLCVTVDDALQEVSLVTRGDDLFAATHIHRLLQALLDLPVPEWQHHRMLTDAAGKRLSKRDGALTLRALREDYADPAEVRAMAGFPKE